MEVVASLSQGRTAAAQCGLFTQKSVPVVFEPPCILNIKYLTYSLVKIVAVFEILQPFLPGYLVRFAMYMWYGHIPCHNCDICVIVVTLNNTYKCLCACSCRALYVFQFNP